MPIGKYKNFAACIAANKDKKDPGAYCGSIEQKIKMAKKKKRKSKKSAKRDATY